MQLALDEESGLFSLDSDESSDEADEDEYFDALDGNERSSGPRTPFKHVVDPRTDERTHTTSAIDTSSFGSTFIPTQSRQCEAFPEKATTPTIPTIPVAAAVTKRSKVFPLPISLPR